MKPINAPLVLALAVGLSLLGACGGDGESDRGSGSGQQAAPAQPVASGPPLSGRQFANRTNRICDELQRRLTSLNERYFSGPPTSAEEISSFFGEVAREVEATLSRLRGLAAPRQARAEIASFHRAAERGLVRLKQGAEGPEEAKQLLRSGDPLAHAQALARRAGLRACTIGG